MSRPAGWAINVAAAAHYALEQQRASGDEFFNTRSLIA